MPQRLATASRRSKSSGPLGAPGLAASLQASLSDSSEPPLRGGRRVRWLTRALEPARARLPEPVFTRLVASLSLLAGIEALVVMQDICGLDSDETIETAGWAARALVCTALEAN